MNVLVVYSHPVGESFNAAVRDAVVNELANTDHDVRLRDLYAEGFNPFLSAQERALHRTSPSTRPELARDVADLRWCNAIVFIYPTWWSGQPAMLKGWFDRAWMNEVASILPEGANRIRPLLINITRLVAVTTHGSPKWMNILEGESGKRTISRSLRLMCSRWCRARWIAFYGMDHASLKRRTAHLQTVGGRVVRALR